MKKGRRSASLSLALAVLLTAFQNCGQLDSSSYVNEASSNGWMDSEGQVLSGDSNGASPSETGNESFPLVDLEAGTIEPLISAPTEIDSQSQTPAYGDEPNTSTPSLISKDSEMLPCGITRGRMKQIHSLLDSVMESGGSTYLIDSASVAANYPQVIYDIQELTANVLIAGENCQDIYILDRLATLYQIPFQFLKPDPNGHLVWPGSDGYEMILYSTQYMYAVAKLINVISKIPRSSWTSSMNSFMYKPRGELKSHLMRWMRWNSINGTCGGPNNVTLPQYVALKRERKLGQPTFCNALTEFELWAAAAAVELLTSPNWVGLSSEDESILVDYIRSTVSLFESRLSTRDACPGGTCHGLLLDVGGFHGHYEYPASLWPIGGETWDFSHMRRLVQWVDTFYLNSSLSGVSYSTHSGMVALLSNELAYQVFNRDYNNPAFVNFWNGWNIPYRSYGPYELSSSYFRAGYGFWGQYRSEIAAINSAILKIVDEGKSTTYLTPGGKPPAGEIDLLGFLASLTKRPTY